MTAARRLAGHRRQEPRSRRTTIGTVRIIRQALGDHVFERLVEAQRAEWGECRRHVSQWERDRSLEVY